MNKLDSLNAKHPNKCAFITGAGSGLGSEFAKRLAQNGWSLHLSDLNLISLEELKPSLNSQQEIFLYELDVSDKNAYEQVVKQVKKFTNKVDLLINNAGIGDGQFFEKYELQHWERMMQINLLGTYYGCHYLLPLIKDQKGIIINIGSAAGFMNAPGMSAYNVSKAAVYSLSESLHHELKPQGIHVCVATPTFFKTNIMSDATGSQKFVDFARKQMKYSSKNAEQMAEVILSDAANGEFHIIHPKEARRSFFIKKWLPKLVNKKFEKMIAKFSR